MKPFALLPLVLLAASMSVALAAPEGRDAPSAPAPAQAVPLPPARPSDLGGPVDAAPTSSAPDGSAQFAKEPDQPKEAATSPTPDIPLPPPRPPELSGAAATDLQPAPVDDVACLRRLERLGVTFEKKAAIENGQCSLKNPIHVRSLVDDVLLEPQDVMVCGVAEALARWTTEVQVAAQKELGDKLRSLKLGGTYVCRGQNHATEAKLSEHSFANAVDIMGFTFEKHAPILIMARPDGTPESAFQKSVWSTACRFFRTVLGPGSNASHGEHLHFDERERKGGHRLCE